MGCACQNRKKRDLTYVRELALKQSILNEKDMQIYQIYLEPIGIIYDYEPINEFRVDIVEIVKYNKNN